MRHRWPPRRPAVRLATSPSIAWRAAPATLAAAISVAYLIAAPRTVDLAASVYRARLFDHAGFTIWNSQWYGGHYTLTYSVLFPPIAWLVGPLVVGAVSSVASAAIFEPLARARFGARARWGATWFGLAATTPLISGRIPFALGVALGLGALLALQRRRGAAAVALSLACSLASPVAGAFLALAALVHVLASAGERAGPRGGRSWTRYPGSRATRSPASVASRRTAGAMVLAGVGPPILLALLFPAGGREPFALSAFLPIPLFAAACLVLLPRRERHIRIGAVAYALAGAAALVVHTPMGGNVVRLGALVGGPLVACAIAGERRGTAGQAERGRARLAVRGGRVGAVLAAALLAALAVWQWSPAVRDVRKAYEDPSTRAAYYTPLIRALGRLDQRGARVEIPFTRGHWEAAEVAPHFPLARGWERQSDIARNGLFYGGVLNPVTYAAWLTEHGVALVALADAKPDYSSYTERGLIESGLPYLRPVWRSRHWRVYRVTLPHPMVVPRGDAALTLSSLTVDHVTLRVQRPGVATVRVEWSPYWRSPSACVERDGEWTKLLARRAGTVRMRMSFTLDRVFSHGRRCG
ncbi:MAG: hypothetical protein JOZ25_08895 [Actinobacteria bacterium]|nr:hypothetical protein [Actinomycetota bacterium]